MWNSIEEMANIHFEDILTILRVSPDPLLNNLLSFMGTSARKTGIAVFIHSLAEHRLHGIYDAMLNKQLFHRRDNNSALLASNPIINVNRHMSDDAAVEQSLDWIVNYENAEHVPVFHDFTESLAVLCLRQSVPSVRFGYCFFVQVVIGFHVLSYPLIRFRLILSYSQMLAPS